jgi:bacteriorhodopsin
MWYFIVGFIVVILCVYIYRKLIVQFYFRDHTDRDDVMFVMLFVVGVILWPFVSLAIIWVLLENISSLLVPGIIKLLKDLPNINIKVSKKGDE